MQKIRHAIKEIPGTLSLYKYLRDKSPIAIAYQQWRWDNYFNFATQHRNLWGQFKDIHKGERCFILGNGPSLKKTDLSHLENEITFGLNRIYLLFDEMGFHTTYYTALNKLVLDQFGDDISTLPMQKFLPWFAHEQLGDIPNTIYFNTRPNEWVIKPEQYIGIGVTVTYIAMQLAYIMGFDTVYLIGVDHSFSTKGQSHKIVVTESSDSNHFASNYFGKGVRWQLPDLEGSELNYLVAKQQFEANNKHILDATIGGKLDVFPKVDYNALF